MSVNRSLGPHELCFPAPSMPPQVTLLKERGFQRRVHSFVDPYTRGVALYSLSNRILSYHLCNLHTYNPQQQYLREALAYIHGGTPSSRG